MICPIFLSQDSKTFSVQQHMDHFKNHPVCLIAFSELQESIWKEPTTDLIPNLLKSSETAQRDSGMS